MVWLQPRQTTHCLFSAGKHTPQPTHEWASAISISSLYFISHTHTRWSNWSLMFNLFLFYLFLGRHRIKPVAAAGGRKKPPYMGSRIAHLFALSKCVKMWREGHWDFPPNNGGFLHSDTEAGTATRYVFIMHFHLFSPNLCVKCGGNYTVVFTSNNTRFHHSDTETRPHCVLIYY